MKTVGQIVTEISAQLNDQKLGREFTRWTRAQLLSHFYLALCTIKAYRPEVFISEVEITLAPGRKQKLASGYERLEALNKNIYSNAEIAEADLDLLKAFWPHNDCEDVVGFDVNGNPNYVVKTFSIDPKDTASFYVSPAVPNGLAPKVLANVHTQVPEYGLSDWGELVPLEDKYIPMIWDYVMGCAYGIDAESPQSKLNSDTHYRNFWTAMGIKYKQESQYRAGFYNGAVGEGNPGAGR